MPTVVYPNCPCCGVPSSCCPSSNIPRVLFATWGGVMANWGSTRLIAEPVTGGGYRWAAEHIAGCPEGDGNNFCVFACRPNGDGTFDWAIQLIGGLIGNFVASGPQVSCDPFYWTGSFPFATSCDSDGNPVSGFGSVIVTA